MTKQSKVDAIAIGITRDDTHAYYSVAVHRIEGQAHRCSSYVTSVTQASVERMRKAQQRLMEVRE